MNSEVFLTVSYENMWQELPSWDVKLKPPLFEGLVQNYKYSRKTYFSLEQLAIIIIQLHLVFCREMATWTYSTDLHRSS